jgi:HlyD family secretion protein
MSGKQVVSQTGQGRSGVRRELLGGLLVCILLVGGLGGWASTTRLDGAVVASGRLTVSDKVKQVQHRDGGIVSDILVRDGTRVDAGQPLLLLDDTAVRGNHAITIAQLVDLVAKRHRLRAEQAGLSEMIETASPLPGMEGLENELRQALAAETTLFVAKRTALAGQKDSISEQIRQLRAGVLGLEARLSATRDQVRYMGEELAVVQALMDKGLTTQRQLSALPASSKRISRSPISPLPEASSKACKSILRRARRLSRNCGM